MFNQTEEDLLLSCVQEVFEVWARHGKADLIISVNNGKAAVHLDVMSTTFILLSAALGDSLEANRGQYLQE